MNLQREQELRKWLEFHGVNPDEKSSGHRDEGEYLTPLESLKVLLAQATTDGRREGADTVVSSIVNQLQADEQKRQPNEQDTEKDQAKTFGVQLGIEHSRFVATNKLAEYQKELTKEQS